MKMQRPRLQAPKTRRARECAVDRPRTERRAWGGTTVFRRYTLPLCVLLALEAACSSSASSKREPCGDGILASAEDCDDQNASAGDGCNARCAVEVGWVCQGDNLRGARRSAATASCAAWSSATRGLPARARTDAARPVPRGSASCAQGKDQRAADPFAGTVASWGVKDAMMATR